MSLLTTVKTGKIKKPFHIVVYGTPKVGKTTFAADSEAPIFLDIEEGSGELNVNRIHPKNFDEALSIIKELSSTNHAYKTLVIDSLDALETMCFQGVAKANGVSDVGEIGFGKGYAQALARWNELYDLLKILNAKMNIIGIAHSTLKKIDDPMKQIQYDKHDIKLRDKMGALSKERADAILFAVFELTVTKDRLGKGRASGDGSRVLLCQGRPSHEAGNRFQLPYLLDLSFDAFKDALNAEKDVPKLKIYLSELAAQLKNETQKKNALKSIEESETLEKLSKIENRLNTALRGA